MTKPAITVIMPVFNRPDLVVDAIESVRAQSFPDWELIVVDDHSTDNTPEVVGNLAAQDERIHFLRRQSPIKGPSACRNEGVGHACSDLLVFLDSDDLLAPDCLAQRVAFMQTDAVDLDFAVFQTEVFRENPGDMGVCFNTFDYEDDAAHFLAGDNIWITTGPLWRKTTLEQLGGWNEVLMGPDDWELSLRALVAGLRYRKIDIADSYFRIDNKVRRSVSGRSFELSFVLNALLAIQSVYRSICQAGARQQYGPILRHQARIRCYDLSAIHNHAKYLVEVWRFHRMGLFSCWDVLVAGWLAGMSSMRDRFSTAADRVVRDRIYTRQEFVRTGWQYKWVSRGEWDVRRETWGVRG